MPDLRQRKQEERFKTRDRLQSAQNVQDRLDGDGAGEQADTYAVDRLEERAAGVVQRTTQTPEQVVSRARSAFLNQRRDAAAHDSRVPSSELPDGDPPPKSSPRVKGKQLPQPKTRSHAEQFRQRPVSSSNPPGTAAYRSANNRAAEQGWKKYTQSTQKRMSQQTQKAAKEAASLGKRAVTAMIRMVGSAIGLLAGGFGGVVLVLLLCIVALVAAVAASPLGIFFSSGSTTKSVPLASAVAQINMGYTARLALLQMEPHDRVEILGQAPDWCDVIAVFACEVSGKDDGMDVTTLDTKRVEKLGEIFWNMCSLSSATQVIAHPDSNPEDGVDDSWEETVLYITVSARTVDEMRLLYLFSDYQNDALDTLLADKAALRDLLGNLNVFQEDALALLRSLPADLSPEREAVVRHALSLVGKVNYFWGGKSRVLGWDSRWGQLQLVWAEGSETTGTYRPFGLDCSGFVDWVFYNASEGEYLIGHGGGVCEQHTYCTDISWEEAQPGDLVFYPDDSHVGIVGGWDEGGNLLVIHCGSGANNVVIEVVGEAGFAVVGRPLYYGDAAFGGVFRKWHLHIGSSSSLAILAGATVKQITAGSRGWWSPAVGLGIGGSFAGSQAVEIIGIGNINVRVATCRAGTGKLFAILPGKVPTSAVEVAGGVAADRCAANDPIVQGLALIDDRLVVERRQQIFPVVVAVGVCVNNRAILPDFTDIASSVINESGRHPILGHGGKLTQIVITIGNSIVGGNFSL